MQVIRRTIMRQRAAGTTVIMIAHDLATVRDADKIVVLKDGRAVEQGTHAALCGLKGEYHKLLASGRSSSYDNNSAVVADDT